MEPLPERRLRLRSWALPALFVLLVVLQVVAPFKGWVILSVGLGGALLVGFLWARWLTQGLHFTREMRFGWAQVGDQMIERFTLLNDARVPALWIEVADQSTVPGYQASRATGVAERRSIRWHRQATCARRGLFTVGPTHLRTADPFGLFSVSVRYDDSVPLLVLPPIVPLPAIEVAPGGRTGEGRPRRNAPERTVGAAGVREYAPGDSQRWIHWPTSARQGSLFVRLFDGTPASDWWILLDMDRRVQAGEGIDSTEEHAVILAASLADRGLRMKQGVGLMAHGEDLVWLPPRTGEGQRWEILRALALVSKGTGQLGNVLAGMRSTVGRHSSLVIITPEADTGWVESLVPLMERGVTPTVLLLDRVSFGGHGSPRHAAALLASWGVVHYVITRDLLDVSVASADRQGPWRRGARGGASSWRPLWAIGWKQGG